MIGLVGRGGGRTIAGWHPLPHWGGRRQEEDRGVTFDCAQVRRAPAPTLKTGRGVGTSPTLMLPNWGGPPYSMLPHETRFLLGRSSRDGMRTLASETESCLDGAPYLLGGFGNGSSLWGDTEPGGDLGRS